jgi:hypothetical protein
VVVNAYYGPDRTPATPLLQPGGEAFEPEVAADGSASGVFVFAVPPELQDAVELEVDPGIGASIVIFTGASGAGDHPPFTPVWSCRPDCPLLA